MSENVVFAADAATALGELLAESRHQKVFVLSDINTGRLCVPRLHSALQGAERLTVGAGDDFKTLDTARDLWQALAAGGATRRSMLVCVGGGMVTDLGGFVASTYQRGMSYINVPTSLLGAVDAAVGGKTGVNLGPLKNQVGVFGRPYATVVSAEFLPTLPESELRSGYGEVLKHALLNGDESTARAIDACIEDCDTENMLELMRDSITTKMRVVESDPTESGLRKVLNLGHTIGHAIESLSLERNSHVPHGYAVAWGLVAELVLSRLIAGFPADTLYSVADFVRSRYGAPPIDCDDYPRLLELMRHDKKNATPDAINFTLLSKPGQPHIDRIVPEESLIAALDIARDLLP